MRLLVPLLLTIAVPAAAAECDLREKELYVEALTARTGLSLWQAEAELIRHRRPVECIEPAPPSMPPPPERITVPVDLPREPEGPGAGPGVVRGLGVLFAGGAITVDYLANDDRDALEETQATGDRDGFEVAKDRFVTKQWIARGLVAGAAAAGVTGLLWLAFGGEDGAVQARPVFGSELGGAGIRF